MPPLGIHTCACPFLELIGVGLDDDDALVGAARLLVVVLLPLAAAGVDVVAGLEALLLLLLQDAVDPPELRQDLRQDGVGLLVGLALQPRRLYARLQVVEAAAEARVALQLPHAPRQPPAPPPAAARARRRRRRGRPQAQASAQSCSSGLPARGLRHAAQADDGLPVHGRCGREQGR